MRVDLPYSTGVSMQLLQDEPFIGAAEGLEVWGDFCFEALPTGVKSATTLFKKKKKKLATHY